MVGIVFISHIPQLAEGLKELVRLVARDVPLAVAAGTDDGRAGTSLEKIVQAIETADQGEGVVLLMDLGSSVMTAEMALDMVGKDRALMLDAPFVEGAIVAATAAERGLTKEEVKDLVLSQKSAPKF